MKTKTMKYKVGDTVKIKGSHELLDVYGGTEEFNVCGFCREAANKIVTITHVNQDFKYYVAAGLGWIIEDHDIKGKAKKPAKSRKTEQINGEMIEFEPKSIYFLATQTMNVPDRIVSVDQLIDFLADHRVTVVRVTSLALVPNPPRGEALYKIVNERDATHNQHIVTRINENFDSSGN